MGYDVYTIETEITKKGAELKAKRLVPKRAKLTRKKRWELLDEDLGYSGKQLDRDVINPSQIKKGDPHLQGKAAGDWKFGDYYYIDRNKYEELESCKVKPFDVLISLVGVLEMFLFCLKI